MSTPATHAARRRLRAQNSRGYVVALVAIGFAGALSSTGWQDAILVVPSLALAAAVLLTVRDRPPNPLLMVGSAVVGVATLVWAALEQANPAGSAGIAITAAVWLTHRRAGRAALLVSTCLGILAVACLALLAGGPDAAVTVVLLTFVGIGWVLAVVESDNENRLVDLLEQAKDNERELSILRERNRFAADLHDIQGHSLHVIKLKAAVAKRLQLTDPDRTAQELTAIERLTAETIDQARRLANSTHALVLAAELANAVELFGAAGIRTRVDHPQRAPGPHETEFALTLREATTNILRHARPTLVTISITPDRLVVRNDGADRGKDSPSRGLATLGDRIREAGGVLDVDHADDTFTLSVSFERGLS
ncbi:sensor histidine kinase [Agromyces humatus]|uniref:sensor histidine kinase n=1 Tax=Agromyces humatus TaxID=279573 RepID=UPI001E473EC8|nr:histidine kinase [Agromyces humatus]